MHTKFLIFIVLLSSCSLSTTESTKKAVPDYKENLRVYISKNYNTLTKKEKIANVPLANSKWMNNLYSKIKHSPIWFNDSIELNKNGSDLIQLLTTSYNYGLDTSRYNGETIQKLNKQLLQISLKTDRNKTAIQIELLLTNGYFEIAKDLNYGIVPKDSAKLVSEIPRKQFKLNLSEYLLNSFKSDSIVNILLKLQPKNPAYVSLQKGLENYLNTASLSKEHIQVEHFRKDSVKAYIQSKKALILHNYLSKNSTDSVYFLALEKFQIKHGLQPDGLIGKNTARALSKSPYDDYIKIIMSLERWRWKNNWDSNYIFVNIPSYEMKVYQKNIIKKRFRVVVGKPTKETAELNDEMEYMIVYPFWNLPYSISSKELLPKIKKDSTYLTRNNYEVFTRKHKPVNANNINWNTVTETNFSYKIRQKGGSSNSLGIIKFIFPNEHSIYFHDTPSKSYFKNDIRAYSHGCVRVQHPLELADLILTSDQNEYNIDSVNLFIENQTQKRITLNHKIPVHIQYFTAEADSNNNIIFYKDIYVWDTKLEELMNLKDHSTDAIIPELVSK